MIQKIRDYFLLPTEFILLRRDKLALSRCNMLDVGCGNHAAQRAKKWFPNVTYYGLDCCNYNNDEEDYKLMKVFYQIDLADTSALGELPDNYFDVIMVCQVIEHLCNANEVLSILCRKLSSGGCMYVEFPGIRCFEGICAAVPSLHFHSDPSHIRVYDRHDIINLFLGENLKVCRSGVSYNRRRLVLLPVILLWSVLRWIKNRNLDGHGLWHILPRSEYVYVCKQTED